MMPRERLDIVVGNVIIVHQLAHIEESLECKAHIHKFLDALMHKDIFMNIVCDPTHRNHDVSSNVLIG